MKVLRSFLICLIPLFGLMSCGIMGTGMRNVSNINTNVDLSRKNFVVLGNVSGYANNWYLFGIGGLLSKNNLGKAYRDMERKANMTGKSRVIINVSYDTYSSWIIFFVRHKITASGTVIEFVDDNYWARTNSIRPITSQEYISNDDGFIMDIDRNQNFTQTQTYPEQNNTSAPKVEINQGSKPVVGDRAYNEYINQNRRVLTSAECRNKRGKVVLAFDVDRQGDPINISVFQSLCQEADREAARLLQNGSKWTISNLRTRLEVDF